MALRLKLEVSNRIIHQDLVPHFEIGTGNSTFYQNPLFELNTDFQNWLPQCAFKHVT